MVKKFEDFGKAQNMGELKKKVEDFMQDVFTVSQENLMRPMPWGDKAHMAMRKPSKISDTGFLATSAVPPYWHGTKDNIITLEYTAPYAAFVEYGVGPHYVSGVKLAGWVRRKLKIKDPKAMRVAYAIATKIGQEGIAPHPFLRPAIEEARIKYGMTIKPLL